MGVGQELTNGLKGVGHVFSFMLKQKQKKVSVWINQEVQLGIRNTKEGIFLAKK